MRMIFSEQFLLSTEIVHEAHLLCCLYTGFAAQRRQRHTGEFGRLQGLSPNPGFSLGLRALEACDSCLYTN